METYQTTAFGEAISVSADWAEAASNVLFCAEPSRYQVADFAHSPTAALRQRLRDLVRDSGDDADDAENYAEIEAALRVAKWTT